MPRAVAAALLIIVGVLSMPIASADEWRMALDDAKGLTPHGVKTTPATHNGKRALQVVDASTSPAEAYALVAGPAMKDGRIDVDLAAQPMASAAADARGFAGVAFRMNADQSAFECFYLRPTNGRADDQSRRNHSTQYVSFPDFPWERLRRDTPGVYESYVDLVPGEWTHVRIDVHDRRAALYVNVAPQPVLIVNDLKLAPAAGGIALWVGPGTEAWFRDLVVTPAGS
jgi:hypothetical protein